LARLRAANARRKETAKATQAKPKLTFEEQLAAKAANLTEAEVVENDDDYDPPLPNLLDIYGYNALVTGCDMDHWYTELKAFTLDADSPSLFIKVSIDAVRALKGLFDEIASAPIGEARPEVEFGDYKEVFDAARQNPHLIKLAADLDVEIKKMGRAFVRTNTRSPKDAGFSMPRLHAMIREHETRQKGDSTSEKARRNRRFVAVLNSLIKVIAVTDGWTAVQIFARSRRIQGDWEELIEQAESAGLTHTQFGVRPFRDFPVEAELRGFVYDGKLTGMSQYHEYIQSPILSDNYDAIGIAAKSFMEDLILKHCPRIEPANSYVTDLVVTPQEDGTFKISLVELNPLCEAAGTCLFTWHKERGKLFGRRPYEFKIHTKVPAFPDNIDIRVKALVEGALADTQ